MGYGNAVEGFLVIGRGQENLGVMEEERLVVGEVVFFLWDEGKLIKWGKKVVGEVEKEREKRLVEGMIESGND